MDFRQLLRILMSAVVTCHAIVFTSAGWEDPEFKTQASEKPTEHTDFLNQLNDMNSPSGDRKNRDAGAVLPFIGLTGSAKQSKNCCQNGGTCILGSFCACPQYFTGRSCEYDERIRNCGIIPHGEWVQKGCSYCRCGYGLLYCFPRVFHGDCDESDEVRWFRSSGARTLQPKCFLLLTVLLVLVVLSPERL